MDNTATKQRFVNCVVSYVRVPYSSSIRETASRLNTQATSSKCRYVLVVVQLNYVLLTFTMLTEHVFRSWPKINCPKQFITIGLR